MQKITIKELVEYNRKTSDRSKAILANKLKTRTAKEKKEEDDQVGGGDYWVTSTSCIYNVIKNNSDEIYENKIDELLAKIKATEIKKTKSMHRPNLEILTNFKEFNHHKIRPEEVARFESVQKVHKIHSIDNIPLYVNPNLVFSFEENGKKKVGAIWLIAKLGGFSKSELGMFCELLYRFLIRNYSEEYQVSENYCTAVDTFAAQSIDYSEMLQSKAPFLIQKTIDKLIG
jgi:hypothetical protein